MKDHRRPGKPKIATKDDVTLEVIQYFVENPNVCLREVPRNQYVGIASVNRILKEKKCKAFKI